MFKLPLLSLYVHIPWCVKKCFYCDFNSHELKSFIPQKKYISHLLHDLENDLILINDNRKISSIFIGGGTPSLFNYKFIKILIDGIKKKLSLSSNVEITIETNPSTVEINQFYKYKMFGINRVSIGIQSFFTDYLIHLGRTHSKKEAVYAANLASELKFNSFNIDLMHGLPNQSLEKAIEDLKKTISLKPKHISWYQLTIEKNTHFWSCPPILPNENILWEIFVQGHLLLKESGYIQYEISNYSKPGYQCQHNLNYWKFGDYLGIGCGAHGKISLKNGVIFRTIKTKHPRGYMKGNYLYQKKQVNKLDIPFEFFMNRFRLFEPIPKIDFIKYTGISEKTIQKQISQAIKENYITESQLNWHVTKKGKLFLNSLLKIFL